MRDVFIVDAIRTPRGKGKADGHQHTLRPVQLGAHVLKSLIERQELESQFVEDVIFGCVTQTSEQGGCIAKASCFEAGFSDSVCGVTLNRFCGSGLEAVNQAAARIGAGQNEILIAGGVESMSRVPMGSDGGAMMSDPTTSTIANFIPQGISADLIATINNYSRRDLDQWAVESHRRASRAQDEGYFKKSIIPIKDPMGSSYLSYDELVRSKTDMEVLAKLKPSFEGLGKKFGFDQRAMRKYPHLEKVNHFHHPGNSSSIVDGSSSVLMASGEAIKKHNLKPRGKIRSCAIVGTEPTIMLTGPAPATRLALQKAELSIEDIDLIEINEAFASVVLNTIDELRLDPEKVNVNGGAIAMGHPLGATGAMLLGTVLDELERRDRRMGLVTLCIGGGMGIATIIERVGS
ncbi:MAG: acetyl-CoA C-acetyltransferase [Halobacteriovoraceae bacterium]|nr:acetyl-CoA C-acetyltransferase [Halobacteriovoraceae bacterium]